MTTASDRPLAVVTGASSGIGLELAKQFAVNRFDLVVAAEPQRPRHRPSPQALGARGVLAEPGSGDRDQDG